MNHNDKVQLGGWADLRDTALPLRLSVFVQEQGVAESLEQDADDAVATHAVVLAPDGTAVATGRVVLLNPSTAKIGRLAVAKRHRLHGLGRRVLRALIDQARTTGVQTVSLHAQCDACAFYQSEGFGVVGEPFMEAGIEHVLMTKQV